MHNNICNCKVTYILCKLQFTILSYTMKKYGCQMVIYVLLHHYFSLQLVPQYSKNQSRTTLNIYFTSFQHQSPHTYADEGNPPR